MIRISAIAVTSCFRSIAVTGCRFLSASIYRIKIICRYGSYLNFKGIKLFPLITSLFTRFQMEHILFKPVMVCISPLIIHMVYFHSLFWGSIIRYEVVISCARS